MGRFVISNIENTLLRRTVLVFMIPVLLAIGIVFAALAAIVEVVEDFYGGFKEAWRGK